jgi:hypothetical protein
MHRLLVPPDGSETAILRHHGLLTGLILGREHGGIDRDAMGLRAAAGSRWPRCVSGVSATSEQGHPLDTSVAHRGQV